MENKVGSQGHLQLTSRHEFNLLDVTLGLLVFPTPYGT